MRARATRPWQPPVGSNGAAAGQFEAAAEPGLSHHEYAIGDPGGHGGGRGAPLGRGSLHQFRPHAGADPGPASPHRCAPGSPEAVSGVGRRGQILDGSRRVQGGSWRVQKGPRQVPLSPPPHTWDAACSEDWIRNSCELWRQRLRQSGGRLTWGPTW